MSIPKVDYTDMAQAKMLADIIREKVSDLNRMLEEASKVARLGIILEVEPVCIDHQEGHGHYPRLVVEIVRRL